MAPAQNFGTASPFQQASAAPYVFRSALASNMGPGATTNNLMRYLRWGIVPSALGAWDITFRLRAVAMRSTAFLPSLIPGCVAWYRPDLGLSVNSGGNVTAWNDQSGTSDPNKNLSPTPSTMGPTLIPQNSSYNNQATVSFNGSGQYFTSGSWSSGLLQPNTWIVVADRETTSQAYCLDGATSGFGQSIFGVASATEVTINAGSSVTTPNTTPYAWNVPSVVLAEFNSGTGNLYMNNFTTIAASGAVGSANFDALALGVHNPTFGATSPWKGGIAEVMAYSGLLSALSKAQLRNYLRNRYNLTIG